VLNIVAGPNANRGSKQGTDTPPASAAILNA
jgi:hypothetical protein